jgi:hypothetical protein
MKPSISHKTKALLKQLESIQEETFERRRESEDPIQQVIDQQQLRIMAVHPHVDLDLLLVVLSNGKVLKRQLSSFARLQGASQPHLDQHEISITGQGIHWPRLDEDLSLRGFLIEELAKA